MLLVHPHRRRRSASSTGRATSQWTGSCGAVFDEKPTFTTAPAKAIATGVWRRGGRPAAVWAGKLSRP